MLLALIAGARQYPDRAAAAWSHQGRELEAADSADDDVGLGAVRRWADYWTRRPEHRGVGPSASAAAMIRHIVTSARRYRVRALAPLSVVDSLSPLPVDVVDSSPVVPASGLLPELLAVPGLEPVLVAGSELTGSIVVNADVSACGDWQAGTRQSRASGGGAGSLAVKGRANGSGSGRPNGSWSCRSARTRGSRSAGWRGAAQAQLLEDGGQMLSDFHRCSRGWVQGARSNGERSGRCPARWPSSARYSGR